MRQHTRAVDAQIDNRIRSRRVAATGRQRLRAAAAAMEMLEPRQFLSTYYVSSTGSDSAAGTSPTSAWRNVSRVNSQSLKAGDTVLFEGGKTFSGNLYFPSTRSGTQASPITISSYGAGRATINSGAKPGVEIAQTSGVSLSNLNFVGNGMTANTSSGIWAHVDWASRALTGGLTVQNVDVTGYGRLGIQVTVQGTASSFSNVRVAYAKLHDNLYGGFQVTGSAQKSNKSYTIDHVTVYNSPGDKLNPGVTGSGIYVADVDGAKISRCVVHDTGTAGAAPVGIWAAGSNRVTIEYCESYNNHTATTTDGGGFDLDWDVSNSTVQYCYSHNNDGPGYIMAAGTHVNDGNTFRYNVSENDGRRNGRAGLQLWGNVTNASIYNNVIFISATGNPGTAAFYAHDSGSNGLEPKNVQVRNNIFYTTGGARIVSVTSGVAHNSTMVLAGNCYWPGAGGTFRIQWGSVASTSTYNSLTAWRTAAKTQEVLNGVATGYQGAPMLKNPGGGGTIGNADNLKNLTAYTLWSSSALINKGVPQPTFLSGTATDFYGNALPKGGKYDIGIDEVA
jgi:hypothetical protein